MCLNILIYVCIFTHIYLYLYRYGYGSGKGPVLQRTGQSRLTRATAVNRRCCNARDRAG